MKLFILPGFSPKNKQWVDDAQKELSGEVVYYHHWTQAQEDNWLDKETDRILEKIGNEKINILAKSIGTAITMKILTKIPSQINKIILCGIPINDFQPGNEDFYLPLASFNPKNIIVFQNESDPHGTFIQAQEFIQKLNSQIEVINKPRSDHEFPYFLDFKKFLSFQNHHQDG